MKTYLQQLRDNCTVDGHLVSRDKIAAELARLLKIEAGTGVPTLLSRLAKRKGYAVTHTEKFVLAPTQPDEWQHHAGNVEEAIAFLKTLPDRKEVE